MSQMKSAAVLRCVRCGQMVVLNHLSTAQADIDGDELHRQMRNVAKHALCVDCQQRRAYYASQGRLEDWEAGRA